MTRCPILLIGLLLAPGLFLGCSEPPPAEPVVRPDATASETGAPGAGTMPEDREQDDEPGVPLGEVDSSREATSGSAMSPPPPEPVPPPEPLPASATPAAPETTNRVSAVAGKSGATRIGTEKCKMCHKVQHASWAESAHALQSPELDCESCHGPGSEYKSMAVMKNPDKAREAGLVMPDKSFCTESCHSGNWQDDMLGRTHAHKTEND